MPSAKRFEIVRAADFEPAPDREPWDRQPNETDKAWGAFQIYRDMGTNRAVRKIPEKLGKPQKYEGVLSQWSSKWGWGVRSAAWDRHIDRQEREIALEEAAKKARQRLQGAELMVGVAIKSLALWNKKLDHALQEAARAEAEGKPPPSSPIKPGDTQRLAETGIKLVELLGGRPTEIEEQRHQLTVEEKRKGIQSMIGNPKLRRAMREVAKAMEESPSDPSVH